MSVRTFISIYLRKQNKNTNIVLANVEMIKKHKLNTSASEMLVVFSSFQFMVEDLIPKYAPEWNVHLVMGQTLSKCL